MPQVDPALAQQLNGRDQAREVAISLAAETGEYNKGMERAAEATSGVADALISVETAFKRTFRTAGATMVGIGGIMTGAAGTAATMAAQFEDAFARVEKTTGLAGRELSDVNEEIREISTRVPVSVDELAHLADISGQLGVEADNLAMYAETAAALGVATEISSHQAVVALSQLIGIFGQAEEDVEGLASSLSVLANETRASEQDIINFSVRVGGVAQTVGATADEMMGIGAAVTGMGLEVEAAGTAIQQVLLDMQQAAQQGGDRLRDFAEIMGITRDEFAELMAEDPARAFHDLVQALGMAEDEAGSLLRQLDIREVRATQTMLTLASASEELSEAMGMSNEAFREAEDVHELAEIRFDTLIQSLTIFRQSVSEIWRSLGQGLLPVLQFMVDRLTDLVNVFNAIPQPIKTAMGALMGLVGVLTTVAGVMSLIFASWHGLIAVLAFGPRIMAAVSAAASRLTAAIGAQAAATGGAAAAMNAFTPALGRVLAGMKSLTMAIIGRGTLFAIKEFGRALTTVTRMTFPIARRGLAALAVAFGKVGAAVLAAWAAFRGGQWVWDQLTGNAEDATSSLESLAESLDTTYDSASAFSGEMEQAAESTKSFADANEELIRTLQALDDELAEADIATTIGRNLMRGGASLEEAAQAVERLLAETGWSDDEIEDFDVEGRLDFDTNVDRVESDVDRMKSAIDGLIEATEEDVNLFDRWFGEVGNISVAGLFSGVDEEIERAWAQVMRDVAHRMESDTEGAIADALEVREAIDTADLPTRIREDLVNQWEQEMEEMLPQIDEEFRGAFARFLQVGGTDAEDLVEALIGDPDNYVGALRDIREDLKDTGIELDNLDDNDLQTVIDALREASEEAARTADEAIEAGDAMSELQRMFEEEGEPSDDPQRSRFREHFLEVKQMEEGHQRVIDLLKDHIDFLEESGDIYGDQWDWARRQLEQYAQEQADLELQDIEQELQARDAGDAVEYLTRRISELGNAMDPATQSLREGMMDLQQSFISDMERDLRRLLDERDRMKSQIDDIRERTNRRIEDMQERHNERMADLEEDHNERLEDLLERRNERYEEAADRREEQLEDAEERFQEQMRNIAEREEQAMEDLAEDVASAYDPMERLQSRPTASARGVLENITQQAEILSEFERNLSDLRAAGLSDEVIEAMGLDDPANFAQVDRMLQDVMADPSVIDDINSVWEERLDIGEDFAENNKQQVKDEHDELRDEAKKEYEETQEEIKENHREAMQEIARDYREAVQDQKEAFREQQQDLREDHRRQIEDTRSDMERQISDIKSDMEDLARESGDDLESLIEQGFDSNIAGIEAMARALEEAIENVDIADSMEDIAEDVVDGWQRNLDNLRDGGSSGGRDMSTPQRPGTGPTFDDSNTRLRAPRLEDTGDFEGEVINRRSTGPGSPPTQLYTGGLVTSRGQYELGEHGTEAVIPLNERGANFMADVMREMTAMQSREAMVGSSAEMAGFSNAGKTNFHIDRVVAHDPNHMARQLKARERLKRLAGGV